MYYIIVYLKYDVNYIADFFIDIPNVMKRDYFRTLIKKSKLFSMLFL